MSCKSVGWVACGSNATGTASPSPPRLCAAAGTSLLISSPDWRSGCGWVAVRLANRAEVLSIRPDFPAFAGQPVGVVAPWEPGKDGTDANFEVRAFITSRSAEDPVTGSLNAGLAQWLIGSGIAPDRYVTSQGTVLGREGRVHVERIGKDIWIGGDTVTCIDGKIIV